MPWGKGMVVEEAYVTSKYHQPTIQLLQFNNGDKVIRFCSYNEGRCIISPLMVDEKDLRRLDLATLMKRELLKFFSKLSE